MKNILYTLAVITILLSSCSKNEIIEKDTTSTFSDSYMPNPDGSRDNSFRKTNMKIVLRKVNNEVNKYKLVVKVDSIAVEVDGTTQYVDVPAEATITAGLSKQNPENIDIDQIIFSKGELAFTKENENGYAVYVSTPFTYNGTLEYELVKVTLGITTNFAILLGKPLNFNETETHMVQQNGKTIIQNPEPEKLLGNQKNNGSVVMQLAISGDPAGSIGYILFKPEPIKPTTPGQLPKVLAPIELKLKNANRNTGVNLYYANVSCFSYYDEQTGKWICLDKLENKAGDMYLMNNNGTVRSAHHIDDWQGETAF